MGLNYRTATNIETARFTNYTNPMKVFGLTGNIASGKSLVASMFEERGAKVIDVDDIARRIVEPNEPGWKKIVDNFGKEILNSDGSIDRKALGSIIFNDSEKRNLLNDITHPGIIQSARDKVEEYRNRNVEVVLIEAALIVEKGGLKDLIDGLIVVIADEESQLKRLETRNDLSREDAISRINSQMPTNEKVQYADFIIDNSGTYEETRNQVNQLWEAIVK